MFNSQRKAIVRRWLEAKARAEGKSTMQLTWEILEEAMYAAESVPLVRSSDGADGAGVVLPPVRPQGGDQA